MEEEDEHAFDVDVTADNSIGEADLVKNSWRAEED